MYKRQILGSPAYEQANFFLANDIVATEPFVESSAIQVEHVLNADDIVGGTIQLDGFVRFVWQDTIDDNAFWVDDIVASNVWTNDSVASDNWSNV